MEEKLSKEQMKALKDLEYVECLKCMHRYWWRGEWRCHLHYLARENYCPFEKDKRKKLKDKELKKK